MRNGLYGIAQGTVPWGVPMFVRLLRIFLVSTVVAGCATNPYTHRHQLDLIPASQERAMGLQAYTQVLNDPKIQISHDPREIEPVERVAARIIEAAKASRYAETAKQVEWQVVVIKDDKNQNAFALPGGRLRSIRGFFRWPRMKLALRPFSAMK
ncbi:MAG: hypothetical protein ABIU05_10435 [Nitrospirales bacterium]